VLTSVDHIAIEFMVVSVHVLGHSVLIDHMIGDPRVLIADPVTTHDG
jgi:hypothetical protein